MKTKFLFSLFVFIIFSFLFANHAHANVVITTNAASNVTNTTADLNGSLQDPSCGGVLSSCSKFMYYFQFGETNTSDHQTSAKFLTNDGNSYSVSQNISGLTSGKTYHYRLVLYNYNSNGNLYGANLSFTTIAASWQVPITLTHTNLTSTSVTLKGTGFNPNFQFRAPIFWIGTPNSGGTFDNGQYNQVIPDANGTVTASFTGLSQGTNYHAWITSEEPTGDMLSRADHDFTTTGSPQGSGTCGNGIKETNEQCDGADLGGKTCATQGFASGTLGCTNTCTFNTSTCVSSGSPATPTVPGWYYEMNDASGTKEAGPFTSGNDCQNDLDLKASTSGVLITKQCYEVTTTNNGNNNGNNNNQNPNNSPVVQPPLDLSTQGGGIVPACPKAGCGLNELLKMVNNFMNFILFALAVPIAAIMFAYAGFLMLTGGGSTEAASKAKSIFFTVVIGLVFCAAAFLIVHTILSILGYSGAMFGF